MVSQKYYLINRDYYSRYSKTTITNIKKKLKRMLKIDIITCHLKKSKRTWMILKITI